MIDQLSHYVLFEQIGAGGIGTVYRAEDQRDGGTVAIKLLHPDLASDPDYVRRFEHEADVAQQLDSPQVVRVLDTGHDGERYFIAMEYVPGQTLADLIEERGRLPIGDVVTAATVVAQALAAANSLGIVHRGISPQNVMITDDGRLKVMGYGVSRDLPESSITTRAQLGGRPFHVAPEMAPGGFAIDIRADIYALGLTIFEMLTGSAPSDAGTPDDASQSLPDVRQLRPETPAWLVAIMYRCLASDPARRFQTPEELLAALASAGDAPTEAIPVAVAPRPARTYTVRPAITRVEDAPGWIARNRARLAVAVGAIAILAIGVAFALGGSHHDGDKSAGAPPLASATQSAEQAQPTATSPSAVAAAHPIVPPTATTAAALPDTPVPPSPTSTTSVEPTSPPADTATSELPADTATPDQTSDVFVVPPSPTATPVPPTATATIAAIDCVTFGNVSDATPLVGSTELVSGRYSCSGKPVSGVPMAALFSFGTSTARCTGVSDDQGSASCSQGLQAATPGQFVSVSVCFAYQGTAYCRQTGFTPR